MKIFYSTKKFELFFAKLSPRLTKLHLGLAQLSLLKYF